MLTEQETYAREREIKRTWKRRFATLTPEQRERWRTDPIQYKPMPLEAIPAMVARNEAYWALPKAKRDPHPENYL